MHLRLPNLYAIIDTATLARRDNADPVAVAEAFLEAGIRLIQFRHKGHFSRQVFQQAGRIAALCRQTTALYFINDRADIALLLDAGLHIGQDDLSPAIVRRLVGDHVPLGFSTHTAEQLAAANREPVDYIAIGPIFSTASKENPSPVVGVEHLPALRALTTKPLVAIGGITRDTAPLVLSAGIDSVAIISDLLPPTLDKVSIRAHAAAFLSICNGML
jgi:thiamine-phosphate pyrophosphorylase